MIAATWVDEPATRPRIGSSGPGRWLVLAPYRNPRLSDCFTSGAPKLSRCFRSGRQSPPSFRPAAGALHGFPGVRPYAIVHLFAWFGWARGKGGLSATTCSFTDRENLRRNKILRAPRGARESGLLRTYRFEWHRSRWAARYAASARRLRRAVPVVSSHGDLLGRRPSLTLLLAAPAGCVCGWTTV